MMELPTEIFDAVRGTLPSQPKLHGECNRCGLCCMDESGRCGFLVVGGEPGEPMATTCSKYKVRFDGMPIPWIRDGQLVALGLCTKDSDIETAVIRLRGIGKGCSLTEG